MVQAWISVPLAVQYLNGTTIKYPTVVIFYFLFNSLQRVYIFLYSILILFYCKAVFKFKARVEMTHRFLLLILFKFSQIKFHIIFQIIRLWFIFTSKLATLSFILKLKTITPTLCQVSQFWHRRLIEQINCVIIITQ